MNPPISSHLTRRELLAGAAALAAAAPLAGTIRADEKRPRGIRQSFVNWCYRPHFSLDELCQLAVALGVESIELIKPAEWPTLKEHGLTCAIAGSHGFKQGFNDPRNWETCRKKVSDSIRAAAEFGCKSVICFTGFAPEGVSKDAGLRNCVEGLKPVVKLAEESGVTLCLEMLNTRDATHPMKGHPGYQGDDTEYCIDICKAVGSPNMKLLFDIYHVQIMNGDVIRRIRQHKQYLGHIHTAGNPGRGELDLTQEINYPACMRALLDVGYEGFVGQEFIPTRDAKQGLAEAVGLCDV